jgi:hypothetical protein
VGGIVVAVDELMGNLDAAQGLMVVAIAYLGVVVGVAGGVHYASGEMDLWKVVVHVVVASGFRKAVEDSWEYLETANSPQTHSELNREVY